LERWRCEKIQRPTESTLVSSALSSVTGFGVNHPRILSFLNRATLPIISTLDKKNITAFKSADEAVFIAYLPREDAHLKSTFTSLASRNHDKFTFGITTDPNLAQEDGLSIPSIICHKSSEGEQEVFSGQTGINALKKFIETATAPLIGEFTRRNEMQYMKVHPHSPPSALKPAIKIPTNIARTIRQANP